MKVNLPPYYAGQKVVAKRNASTELGDRLIKDEKYTVEKCEWISLVDSFAVTVFGNLGLWHPTKDLVPVEEQPMPLLTFEKIKEKETEEILTLN